MQIALASAAERLRLAATASNLDLTNQDHRRQAGVELAELFLRIQIALRPEIIAEVGAFDARFSQAARKVLPEARIVAFEANPHNYAHWTAQTPYSEMGIEYLHLAVSDKKGETDFLVQTAIDDVPINRVEGNHSLLPRSEAGVQYESVRVKTVRLDDFLGDQLGRSSLSLWIDVEGATAPVFAGAERSLAIADSIMIEVEEHRFWENQWLFREVHEHLYQRGFHAVARDFEQPFQFNVVFVHSRRLDEARVMDAIVNFYSRVAQIQ